MKRSKFTEAQIAFILRHAEEGTTLAEICRKGATGTRRSTSMYCSPGASDSSRFPAELGANIYPASPGTLAHPNG